MPYRNGVVLQYIVGRRDINVNFECLSFFSLTSCEAAAVDEDNLFHRDHLKNDACNRLSFCVPLVKTEGKPPLVAVTKRWT